MKPILISSLLILLSIAGAQAAERTIAGRVTGDQGEAVAGAFVTAGDGRVATDADGRFQLRVATDADGRLELRAAPHMPVSLRIAADGYYTTIHTFAREDLEATAGDLGTIEVVARKPGRRLLLFAGDAMLARRYFEPRDGETRLVRRGKVLEDGQAVLATIKPYIDLADLASVNMETQLSKSKLTDRLPKSVTFYSPPELAALLEWAGFDYVALGNNHTWDYQAQGLSATYAALGKTGLGYSGAGFDEATARAPFKTELDGEPYAFLSYVGWAGTFSPSQAAEGSKGGAALGNGDVFVEDLAAIPTGSTAVVQLHSGLEYAAAPAGSVRTDLRTAIDNGADLAIAHHPHVLQGIELYRDGLIAYSMGNFLFDQYIYSTQLGMLLYVWMDGDVLYRAEVVPMYVNGYIPTPATGNMRYSILHRIARLSRPLGTCLQMNGAHARVAACGESPARRLDLAAARPGSGPIHVGTLGIAPTDPVALAIDGYQYRVGTDILRRGDFESYGLFDTPGRGWLLDKGVSIEAGESRQLQVRLKNKGAVRTGMSAFDRVFTPSAPTTFSGRVYTDGPALIRFQLQRRRIDDSFSEALAKGPLRAVGGLRIDKAGWHGFAIDFDQPRISTRSVRVLIDVADDPDVPGGVEARFDDLAWIEWRTPWLSGREANFATHVQFRSLP
ncbi:MAG: CapA family protein [Gammaproteobacteria bacterium]|nr:CapA family protein [Gammaproteobacteria bacterium]NNF49680.1 hypothetical protein [Woeseiaceae bacterium]MBT8095097.1 CapA family protein [Gammaproteobacteria bacterium]MBT8105407.1 CapA family protein [Gammaproteobacteria bacterium]NNK25421.1 hypothetical protein [Woeseiaceae bacterium]